MNVMTFVAAVLRLKINFFVPVWKLLVGVGDDLIKGEFSDWKLWGGWDEEELILKIGLYGSRTGKMFGIIKISIKFCVSVSNFLALSFSVTILS